MGKVCIDLYDCGYAWMLDLLVCAVFVCLHVCVVCVHTGMCVLRWQSTLTAGPSFQAHRRHLLTLHICLSSNLSLFLSIYCFLTLPLACLLSHSPQITVAPFHFILPQTPHLSLVSLIRQYYQPQWLTRRPASLSPAPSIPPSSPYSHPLSPSSPSSCLIFLIFCSFSCLLMLLSLPIPKKEIDKEL